MSVCGCFGHSMNERTTLNALFFFFLIFVLLLLKLCKQKADSFGVGVEETLFKKNTHRILINILIFT